MGMCFATLDTTAKYLGQTLPVIVGLFARYALQALIMGVWLAVHWLRGGGNLFRTAHPRFQTLRGSLLLATSALLFFGIPHMPVAEFTSVGMLTPVIVTVLAATFLHEHVSPLRAALVVGGFIGALIVVRPGSGLFGWVACIPLVMALIYAGFQLLTRRLSHLEHPLTTHFYTGLVGTVVVGLVALAFEPVLAWSALRAAPPSIWALLVLAGCMGTAGHLCLILALGVAPMPVLMPFTYLQIAFASFAGWVAFRHVPDGWAFVGMAVVAACGAASVWLNLRESAAAQRIAPSDSALTPD
ncbi:MAG: DMT family transporter [Rhizobacter sp.]|nr:DMT family transporter [Rhizobacter sp.]